MGCPGCLLTEKEIQQQMNAVLKTAKETAIRTGNWFVVYYDMVENKVTHLRADLAQEQNIQGQFVAPH